MIVEFLVDKSDFKKLLSSINFVAKNSVKVEHKSHKIKGKANYILSLICDKKNVPCAKALSEMRITVEKVFNDNNIKFRILVDETLQFFATNLYPLACDFEIKLRSLIYMVLFDIDEQANSMTVERYKKTIMKADKNMAELPQDDFLAHLTFEEIFNFLFDNNVFIAAVKDIISQAGKKVYDRRMTKAEVIKDIEAIEEQTIWKTIFEPLFPKSVIPHVYNDIQEYRNMIMHVRDLDYTNFDRIKHIYKKAIKDLAHNLSTGLVADDSKINIGLLAQTFVNSFYLFKQLYDVRDAISKLAINPALRTAVDQANDIHSQLAAIMKPIGTFYSEDLDRITTLQRTLGTIHVDSDLRDRISELQRTLPRISISKNHDNTADSSDGSDDE